MLSEGTESFYLQANVNLTDVANTTLPRGEGFIIDNDFTNLFSPNNDGKSDVFIISGLETYPNFILTIYNRSGNIIYNYSNNGNTNPLWWNGTNNGKPVAVGVYYYTLNFNDGKTKPVKSFVQLVR